MLREHQRALGEDLTIDVAEPMELPTTEVQNGASDDDLLLTLGWAESQILRAVDKGGPDASALVKMADEAVGEVSAASANLNDDALRRVQLVQAVARLVDNSTMWQRSASTADEWWGSDKLGVQRETSANRLAGQLAGGTTPPAIGQKTAAKRAIRDRMLEPAAARLDRWLWLVERSVGIASSTAIRDDKCAQVERLLQRFWSLSPSSDATVAEAALRLAQDVYALKPLIWFLAHKQAVVAAATAFEELRNLGWSPEDGAERALAELLREDATGRDTATVSLQMLSLVLSNGGSPARARQLNAAVYLSLPFSNCTPAMRTRLAGWSSDIEEALEQAGARSGLALFLAVPGLRERDCDELVESVRAGMMHSVLHLVLGAGGGTPGIGRELQSSISRRRPVAWLMPSGHDAPRSVHAAASEADLEIIQFTSSAELRSAVQGVVDRRLPAMRELLHEKNSLPLALIELQSEMRRRWLRASPSDVLTSTRITPERANLLLTDPFVLFHEATWSELDAFGSALGIGLSDALGGISRARGPS
jgi:hypothetical protein